jgi:hypothetical protein
MGKTFFILESQIRYLADLSKTRGQLIGRWLALGSCLSVLWRKDAKAV